MCPTSCVSSGEPLASLDQYCFRYLFTNTCIFIASHVCPSRKAIYIFGLISFYIYIYSLILYSFNFSCPSKRAICIIRSISLSTVTQLYMFNSSCLQKGHLNHYINISLHNYFFTGYIHYGFNSSFPSHPSRRATFIIELRVLNC